MMFVILKRKKFTWTVFFIINSPFTSLSSQPDLWFSPFMMPAVPRWQPCWCRWHLLYEIIWFTEQFYTTKWNFTILQQKVSLKGYQASQESPKHPMCNSWHNSKTRWDFKKYSFIYFHWLRCNCLHVSGISPHCNTRKDSCIILSDEECTVLGSGTKKQTIFFVRAQKTSLCTVRSVFGLCHHRNKVINVVVLLN